MGDWRYSMRVDTDNRKVTQPATVWNNPNVFKVVDRASALSTSNRSIFITVKNKKKKGQSMDFADFQAWDYELIHLPEGTFNIDDFTEAALYATGVPKMIIGAGETKTTLKMPTLNTNKPGLGFFECPQVVLGNFTLDANCDSNIGWNTGIDIRGCTNVSMFDMTVKNAGNTGIRLCAGGIPGSGNNMPDSANRTTYFSMMNVKILDTNGPSAVTFKSGGAKYGQLYNVTADGWKSQGFSFEGEDLHGTPDTNNPGGYVSLTDCKAINATGTGSQAWGVAVTENMTDVVVARPTLDNIEGTNSYAGVLISPSPTQDNTPVNKVTLIDVNPTNMNHQPGGASSSDIRIVDNGNLVTNVEMIRCSSDVIYHTP